MPSLDPSIRMVLTICDVFFEHKDTMSWHNDHPSFGTFMDQGENYDIHFEQ
jgi:hypothetical protein